MISRVDQYFNIVGSNYMVMAMALEALFLWITLDSIVTENYFHS